ncbi:hypothetical protein [Streptomyces sp. ME01-18h]|uniref:hypothetical protein n=1 Tax=Streptomyces sp. ME01-18h TaxID=462920 RepID=UPI0029B546B5|nr:hypothetical protein [Streptomyces sp. ME01-18h]MDX3398426.1 hypothetical protein [Streptomyces sp. ME01-18h]
MGLFSRRPQSTRDYPAAGVSVTGDSGRFRRAKTSGARRAGRDAERWEQADRARTKRGGTFLWRN